MNTTTLPVSRSRILVRVLRGMIIVLTGVYAAGLMIFLASRTVLADAWWFALLTNFTPLYFLPIIILLPLMLYWRTRLLSLLLLILTVYALVFFGRYSLPRQISATSGDTTLAVTTFNMSDRNAQTEDIAPWLEQQNADIVLLQEAPTAWATYGIAELRSLYPYQTGYILANDTNGAVVLSKYPLRAGNPSDSFFRVAAMVGTQPIVIYNVSLTTPVLGAPREPIYLRNKLITSIWDMAWGYDDTPRNQELEQLLAQVEAEPFPVIVAGDFNMSDFTPNYDLWASRLNDSFREAGYGFGGTWPMFKHIPSPGFVRLDYIWHSQPLTATSAELGPYLGSDHLPLISTLQF